MEHKEPPGLFFKKNKADSVKRPTMDAKPCRNFKEMPSKVNILSGFIRAYDRRPEENP